MRQIDGKTKLVGLIGRNISHSKSPSIHNYGYDKLNLNYRYLCFDIKNEDLEASILGMKAMGVRGFNVTTPYKEEILKYVKLSGEEAKFANAVNTVIIENNELHGYNTDGNGLVKALKYNNINIKNKKVLVVGLGGAGKSIAYSITKESPSLLTLANRNSNNFKVSMNLFRKINNINIDFLDLANIKEFDLACRNADIIINATTVGFHDSNKSIINNLCLNNKQVVFDINYAKGTTKLINDAREKGCKILKGEDLLLWQGIIGFELFTKCHFPITSYMKAQKSNIYLIGFMGTGKSSCSKILSKKLKRQLFDVDEEIIKREKRSIPEIFNNESEEYFRNVESEILSELAEKKNIVVACGGGIINKQENINIMKKSGYIICLNANNKIIYKRIVNSHNKRPLLLDENGNYDYSKLVTLKKKRYKIYRKAADINVDTSNLNIYDACKLILSKLKYKYRKEV